MTYSYKHPERSPTLKLTSLPATFPCYVVPLPYHPLITVWYGVLNGIIPFQSNSDQRFTFERDVTLICLYKNDISGKKCHLKYCTHLNLHNLHI